MRKTHHMRRDSEAMAIIRQLDQQGLGRGHDLYPNAFWMKTDVTDKKRGR